MLYKHKENIRGIKIDFYVELDETLPREFHLSKMYLKNPTNKFNSFLINMYVMKIRKALRQINAEDHYVHCNETYVIIGLKSNGELNLETYRTLKFKSYGSLPPKIDDDDDEYYIT